MESTIQHILKENPCHYRQRYHRFSLRGPPTIQLRGLLPFLEDAVFSAHALPITPTVTAGTVAGAPRVRVKPMKPIALGRRVDRELHSLCSAQALRPCATFVRHRYKKKRSRKSFVPRIHVHTQVYLLYWKAQGACLLASQVPVACRSKKMATAVDQVLFIPRKRELVIVELKNSSLATTRAAHPPTLQEPFAHLVDTSLNRFLLQLACTFVMFQQTFPSLAQLVPCQAALLVLDQKTQQVLRYAVPQDLLDGVQKWLA
jgi:hypothetical protein